MKRAAVLLLACASPVTAAPFEGNWCGMDSGEVMNLSQTDLIGFNEHTLCYPDSPVFLDNGSWSGTLTCKNAYPEEIDGNWLIHEVPLPDVTIRIDVPDADHLIVTPQGRAAETYEYCG